MKQKQRRGCHDRNHNYHQHDPLNQRHKEEYHEQESVH